jgi:hypothetical protein
MTRKNLNLKVMTLPRLLNFSIALLLIFYLAKGLAYAQGLSISANLISAIEARTGTQVIWVMGRRKCKSHSLMGCYSESERSIYICQSNHGGDYEEILGTLKHEGWHAVQSSCNSGRAALSDDDIRARMRIRDIEALKEYPPEQRRLEAEARVFELLSTSEWIDSLYKYCGSGP